MLWSWVALFGILYKNLGCVSYLFSVILHSVYAKKQLFFYMSSVISADWCQCCYQWFWLSWIHTWTSLGVRLEWHCSSISSSQHPTLFSYPKCCPWDSKALKSHVKDFDNAWRLPQPLLSCSLCYSLPPPAPPPPPPPLFFLIPKPLLTWAGDFLPERFKLSFF